jgi:F-type H+-transporting ATPase subunit delta
MVDRRISRKYSQALFTLGKEQNRLISFEKELKMVQDVINNQRDLKTIFYQNRFLLSERKAVLHKIFSGRISKTILNFILFLLDKRREAFFATILKEYIRLVKRELKMVEVEVISAVVITDEQRELIKQKLNKLSGYQIEIRNRIDPDIIGGLILKTGNYLIDGSIRGRLNSLKQKLEYGLGVD